MLPLILHRLLCGHVALALDPVVPGVHAVHSPMSVQRAGYAAQLLKGLFTQPAMQDPNNMYRYRVQSTG